MADHSDVPHEVDVIIAGGGAAGCVVAGRLAKADPSLEVLVIEGGIGTKNNPLVIHPALFAANQAPGTKTILHYESKPSEHIAGRKVIVPSGGCLGGGGSVNFLMYTRGQAIDYDDWDTEGWSAEDLVPLLRKTEKFHIDHPHIDRSVHGYDGDFSVSRGTFTAKAFQDDFVNSAASLGIKEAADANNLSDANAVCGSKKRWPMWINPETGFRQDVPHRLIYPTLDAGNTKLSILTESKVVRVLFDENKRAVGVEYVPATGAQADSSPAVVKARKLVVVSAGALGSPQILQRSGIGNEQKLSPLGISVVSAVDGVGAEYQDHNLVTLAYRSNAKPENTLDGLLSGRISLEEALKQKELSPSKNVLGWNGIDVGTKLRPSPEEVKALGPAFEELWNRDYRDRPTRPLSMIAVISGFVGDPSKLPPGQYFLCGMYNMYPYSRGSIYITGPSVNDPPDFDCGFLSHPADTSMLIWMYKEQREIFRRMEHYEGIVEEGHPMFREGSKAAFAYVDGKKTPGAWENIEYDKDDDEAIVQFLREKTGSAFHSMATCPMKPLEDGGAVDKHLNVYGVRGLKVADLSICPKNVGANTYSTALLIGEKAATIIAEELGIKM